ncbi:FAD binding domain-containing protein [Aeromicrobium massiliense]|uniref:FAD binding domain-containing protein n=1 Tax=Aeromicrobium massiliense TaxID=1464554 RepID=UPI0002DFAFB5|nr:xanthine dehydrogenase family protein subunit M [Aeromicrobium massiliense]
MRAFDYVRPESADEALALLAEPGTSALAGGTNLVDLMRLGVARPERVVDVDRLGSTEVVERDGSLWLGAGVRNSDLAAHPVVRERLPALSRALLAAASGQLRNRASTGGNLLQRTRCVYFMDPTKPCNKREPGTGCPAVEGLSRDLAVLGHSEHCIATHPGDMSVALVALDAVVHVRTADGELAIPAADFHRLPGDEPHRDTKLPPGALVTAVEVPLTPLAERSTYRKARDRRSFAFGLVTVAAALTVEDGVVDDVRLVLGSVAHKPWRATVAEDAIRGRTASGSVFDDAVRAELAAARPTDQNAFKVELARRLSVATLHELAGGQA